jgi:hypothetical protein
MNRRSFLKKLLVATGAGLILKPNLKDLKINTAFGAIKVPKIPWGYIELDPDEAFKRGYLGYLVGECSGGAFWAIMSLLREKVGYPYTLLPLPTYEEMLEAHKKGIHLEMPMKYGNGGIVGYGTVCGALNGAASAIYWIVGSSHKYHDPAKQIIRRLFRWYEETPFPTPLSNEYAKKGLFPVKGKTDKVLPSVKTGSVLCHVTVSKWCYETGYASGSKERSERCARITADTARQAVILLNAYLKGELEKYPFKLSKLTAQCRSCHYKGKNYTRGEFARGFIQCETCHLNLK